MDVLTVIDPIAARVRSNPIVVDAAAVTLVMVLVVTDVATGGFETTQRAPDLLAYVLLFGQILPFLFRRRYPVAVMWLMVASIGLYWILNYPAGADGSGIIAIYSALAYGSNRRWTWINAGAGVVVLTAIASPLASDFFVDDDAFTPLVLVGVLTIHVAAAVFGEVVYQRRQRAVELHARAARAEAAVETSARLAVVEERTRIAREMHDIVAHGMSVIAVQAAAAQDIVVSNPERTVAVLEAIEETGREALNEMRRMLGVLRGDETDRRGLSPQPTLNDLDNAITHCVTAGLPTALVVTGERQQLAPGLELAAFRVIQEALTNALKHAGDAAKATVTLDYGPTEISITVADDGRGAITGLAETGSGNGLIGMRERVDAYHGHLTAGPRHGGGYQVSVVLPLDQPMVRLPDEPADAAKHEQLA